MIPGKALSPKFQNNSEIKTVKTDRTDTTEIPLECSLVQETTLKKEFLHQYEQKCKKSCGIVAGKNVVSKSRKEKIQHNTDDRKKSKSHSGKVLDPEINDKHKVLSQMPHTLANEEPSDESCQEDTSWLKINFGTKPSVTKMFVMNDDIAKFSSPDSVQMLTDADELIQMASSTPESVPRNKTKTSVVPELSEKKSTEEKHKTEEKKERASSHSHKKNSSRHDKDRQSEKRRHSEKRVSKDSSRDRDSNKESNKDSEKRKDTSRETKTESSCTKVKESNKDFSKDKEHAKEISEFRGRKHKKESSRSKESSKESSRSKLENNKTSRSKDKEHKKESSRPKDGERKEKSSRTKDQDRKKTSSLMVKETTKERCKDKDRDTRSATNKDHRTHRLVIHVGTCTFIPTIVSAWYILTA